MHPEYLRLGMDSFLLFFLVLTVYFAFRLSKNLREFRSYRAELETIMKTLGTQLERAQSVIQDIKEISQSSGQDIDVLVAQARIAIEDLKAVNEVSEALARRLERAARAQGTGATATGRSVSPSEDEMSGHEIQGLLDTLKNELEFENDVPEDIPEFLTKPSPSSDAPPQRKLRSAAEQDLYEALQKNKDKTG